ncbi:MAG: ATP-binding protein, partial [Salibacteraceae bacterium]|nr:ATP-binding protein [Salibacteraceae bacterium]
MAKVKVTPSRNGNGDKKLVKLAIVGPESSGKTALAQALAEEWNEPFVEEYAREYLETIGRNYNQDDLLEIAKGQLDREYAAAEKANHFLICDTNTLVVKIWAEVRFGRAQNWIERQFLEKPYQLYILCGHENIEWEEDELREHPDEREMLYDLYKKALVRAGKQFLEVDGT